MPRKRSPAGRGRQKTLAGPPARPLVVAHRGASADCPENTFAAFDLAAASGAEGLELDLQLSKDGVVMVYHDATLEKAGRGGRSSRRSCSNW